MGENQNWYRQLLALLLLSTAKAAVEYLTNPGSRKEAADQLRDTFKQIDYDAAAKALTRAIDDAASTSKDKVDSAIDSLRDRGVEVVGEAKQRAEKQAGKRGGGKWRFIFALAIGGVVAYFLVDEQRRDDILDRLTGASGPIEQTTQSVAQTVTDSAREAVDRAKSTGDAGQPPVEGSL